MTSQEQNLLEGLTARVNGTQLADKDQEAEQYLGQALGRNPDAIYILAQTVLVQQYALDQVKQQLAQLRQEAEQARQQAQQQPAKHTSFLGSLLGTDEPSRPAAPPPLPSMQAREPQYAPVPNYAPSPQQYGQPQYGQPVASAPQGGGGFLRSAMQTATGVAAGAFAFEGIESLLHGFGSHAGYGGGSGFGGFGGGGFAGGGREEVVNNYYGDARPESGQSGLSPDLEDRRDDSSGGNDFADTNGSDSDTADNAVDDDTSSLDDSGDSSGDDSGSFDDSGF